MKNMVYTLDSTPPIVYNGGMKNNQYSVTSAHPQVLTLNPISTGHRVFFTGTEDECKVYSRGVEFANAQRASVYKGRAFRITEVSEIPEIEVDR